MRSLKICREISTFVFPLNFKITLRLLKPDADLVRSLNLKGGNYVAYGSIAMIQLGSKISDAIVKCRKSLKVMNGQGEENEVERLVRPRIFGSSMDRKTVMVMARHITTKRKSLVAAFLQKKNSVEFMIEEEDENVDNMWYEDIRDSDVFLKLTKSACLATM